MTDAPYISPLDQARILSEALPHMQQYDEETIVIKYGGHAMGAEATARAFAKDIVLLEQTANNPEVVHGSGPQYKSMPMTAGGESHVGGCSRDSSPDTRESGRRVSAGPGLSSSRKE